MPPFIFGDAHWIPAALWCSYDRATGSIHDLFFLPQAGWESLERRREQRELLAAKGVGFEEACIDFVLISYGRTEHFLLVALSQNST